MTAWLSRVLAERQLPIGTTVADWPTSEMSEFVINGFSKGDYDEVSIIFTEFVSDF